jgi:nitroreductase/NAD-dependent dihydropyrimidine dehydrogenase PreA subunit
MVKIDSEKCTGCSICVNACHSKSLVLHNSKAQTAGECSLLCGHCVAICPQNAVGITEFDMDDVTDIATQGFTSDGLLSFIKSRRSIRRYQARPVERKLVEQMIQAGRYTPTSANRQELSFIVIEKEMQAFRKLVIERVGAQCHSLLLVTRLLPVKPFLHNIAKRAVKIAEGYKRNPNEKDEMFFDAPIAILIAGDNEFDAGLATMNMELVANANGLGVLYSSFITSGVNSSKMKEIFGVPKGKKVYMVMLVGYPNIQFKRSAPRKKADVIWR